MNIIEFKDVFEAFKKLNSAEKMQAIIDFLKNDIISLNKLNSDINNKLNTKDIYNIMDISIDDKLDAIFQMLHVLTEQIELFSEKISNDFFE